VGKHKEYRDTEESERDAGSITSGALGEAGMTRRSVLGQIGRWSAALAVFGLGPEAWMQVVSGRSIISSAAAAATRHRGLHPFPSDDPFNMPLGVNAWYAPTTDPATADVLSHSAGIKVNNGWSHPVYVASNSDPITRFEIGCRLSDGTVSQSSSCVRYAPMGVRSYRSEEHNNYSWWTEIRCPTSAVPAVPSSFLPGNWYDGHMHVCDQNELLESFVTEIAPANPAWRTSYKLVRNRLDHYSFGFAASNPLKNVAGTRAWGGVSIAGLVRIHEIDRADPYIPHALALDMRWVTQLTGTNQGNSSSPTYGVGWMFPATTNDHHGQYPCKSGLPCPVTGSIRMGMRFALDPTICTDAWINANAPNIHQAAIARALRDYGAIVSDESDGRNVIAVQQGVSSAVERNMVNFVNGSPAGWSWCKNHMRRIAGRTSPGGSPIHIPTESHWNTWRNNGEGWGGGVPRVPYSPPLAPLSGDVPSPLPPEAPRAIEVTGARTFDGIG
jgi:hypothetical protein